MRRRFLSTCIAVTIGATALGVGAVVPANAATTTSSPPPSADWAWTARAITDEGNRAFQDANTGAWSYEYARFETHGDASWYDDNDTSVKGGKTPNVGNLQTGSICWKPAKTDRTEDPLTFPFAAMTKPAAPARFGELNLLDGSTAVTPWGLVRNTLKFHQPLDDKLVLDISGCDATSDLTGDFYIPGASTATGSFGSKDSLGGSDSWWSPVALTPGPVPLSDSAAVTATMMPHSQLRLDFSGLTDTDRSALRQEGAAVTVLVDSLTRDDKQLTQEIKLTFSDEPTETPTPPTVIPVGDPGPTLFFDTGIGSASLGFWSTFGISLLGLGGATLVVVAVRDLRRRREATRQR